MSIVRWRLGMWSDVPVRCEFERETAKSYFDDMGRRTAKAAGWTQYFETEAEALEQVAKRKEREAAKASVDRIKEHGPQLLEALEILVQMAIAGDKYSYADHGMDYVEDPRVTKAKEAISSARGK